MASYAPYTPTLSAPPKSPFCIYIYVTIIFLSDQGEMSKKQAVPIVDGILREGLAKIPVNDGVFYNMPQVINRDLSCAVIQTYVKQLKQHRISINEQRKAENRSEIAFPKKTKLLEALSATGLRSIRYALEVDQVDEIIANDIDAMAAETIRKNRDFNGISPERVVASHADAKKLLYEAAILPGKYDKYDVVDLDPYGTCAPFIDGAVQAVNQDGLLCITSTDMKPLSGTTSDACYQRYGGTTLRGKHAHEMAVRLVLGTLSRSAAIHNKTIEPLCCLHINFYIRLFVKVRSNGALSKRTASLNSLVFQCKQCTSLFTQPMGAVLSGTNGGDLFTPPAMNPLNGTCRICGGKLTMGGPIWNGNLCDPAFVEDVMEHIDANVLSNYNAAKSALGLLSVLKDEVPECPLFLHIPRMCRQLKLTVPRKEWFFTALQNHNYLASVSHTDPDAVKTNAPIEFLWDILRYWHKKHPCKNPTAVAERILGTEPTHEINFDGWDAPRDTQKKAARFVPNPAHWGPGKAGKMNVGEEPPRKKRKIEE